MAANRGCPARWRPARGELFARTAKKEQKHDKRKNDPARGHRLGHPAELKPLGSNGQDQKIEPPADDRRHGIADQPLQCAHPPASCSYRQCDGEQSRLSNHQIGRCNQHDCAGQEECESGSGSHPREQQERACARQHGSPISPPAPKRHGALETDHGPQKAGNHDGAMECGERRSRPRRQRDAEPRQPGPKPECHRQPANRERNCAKAAPARQRLG